MAAAEPFHWCCCGGIKKIDNHWLLWGRPRSRFPFQGMVGPDWRVGLWTFLSIPAVTAGWACLIIFGAPNDGDDEVRHIIVIVGAVIALITMVSYLSTACTDPGIVFKHMALPVSSRAGLARGFLGGGGRTVAVAPAGAGTPTPEGSLGGGSYWDEAGGLQLQQQQQQQQRQQQKVGSNGGGISGGRRGGQLEEKKAGEMGGAYPPGDLEAQQILKILEDDYQHDQGVEPTSTAAPSTAGLPPDQCVAAADAGSTAVADMRHVPPPVESNSESVGGVGPLALGQTAAGGNGGGQTTVCGRCQIVRPAGAMHCTLCGVCVDKLDHHCPFMGQCVGKKTLVMFYVFIITVWFLIVYVLVAVAYLVVATIVDGF